MRIADKRMWLKSISAVILISGFTKMTWGTEEITQNFVLSGESEVVGPTSSDVTIDPFNYFQITLDQFDSSLGTLDGLTFSYDLSFTATGTVNDSSSGSITLAMSATLFTNDHGFISNGAGNGTGGTLGDELSLTVDLFQSQSFLRSGLIGAEDEIIGTGTFDLLLQGDFRLDGSRLGTNEAVADFDGGTVTWTYEYTPVPEPGNFGLLTGLIALCWIARRRKKLHCYPHEV